MRRIGGDVPSRIESDAELDQQLALHRSGESHRQQNQLGLDLELATRYPNEVASPIGERLPLQANSVNALHTSVLA